MENRMRCLRGIYSSVKSRIMITDGTDYKVFINSGNKYNYIHYPNPESYLKRYPDIR